MGEKDFQMIVSQMLIAIKTEIAELPNPWPLESKSSKRITIIPANVNYKTINKALP